MSKTCLLYNFRIGKVVARPATFYILQMGLESALSAVELEFRVRV